MHADALAIAMYVAISCTSVYQGCSVVQQLNLEGEPHNSHHHVDKYNYMLSTIS